MMEAQTTMNEALRAFGGELCVKDGVYENNNKQANSRHLGHWRQRTFEVGEIRH